MKVQTFNNICAVILSGGKSSRMRQDKSLLEFDRYDTITEYQYRRLSNIFDNVYISSKSDKFDFLDSKEFLILDNFKTFSPMIALDTIFEKIPTQKIFILSVDMPLLETESIQKLVNLSMNSSHEIVIAKDTLGNRHSLCGVFDRSIHKQIKECLKNDIHKINHLINNSNHKEILFEKSEQFLNMNTPLEYTQAKNLHKDSAQISTK